jgi:hypothetical protein
MLGDQQAGRVDDHLCRGEQRVAPEWFTPEQ